MICYEIVNFGVFGFSVQWDWGVQRDTARSGQKLWMKWVCERRVLAVSCRGQWLVGPSCSQGVWLALLSCSPGSFALLGRWVWPCARSAALSPSAEVGESRQELSFHQLSGSSDRAQELGTGFWFEQGQISFYPNTFTSRSPLLPYTSQTF